MANDNDKLTKKEQLMLRDHDSLIALHNSEISTYWQAYQFFLVMNSILIAATTVLLTQTSVLQLCYGMSIGVAVFGLVVSILWFFVNERGYAYLCLWLQKAKDIEREIKIDSKIILRTFHVEKPRKHLIETLWKTEYKLPNRWFNRMRGITAERIVILLWVIAYAIIVVFILHLYLALDSCPT